VHRYRILIIGAYGQFGRRIAGELADDESFELILAGRNLESSETLIVGLQNQGARAVLRAAAIDVDATDLVVEIAALSPRLVIHTAGPFQHRDYRVAEASLACGAHYVDLADGRDFVMGIDRLDEVARANNLWAISGASSVPGLSAAVVQAHIAEFASLDSVESAISPGNQTPRGLATTQAILGYVGQRFPALQNGRWRQVHGWQSLRRLRVPGIGPRWTARCDVPDLAVLPKRYPELKHCDFRAGLELDRMHWGLWLASWGVRAGLVPNLARWAQPLIRASELWIRSGTDTGVMSIQMRGLGLQGERRHIQWSIIARDGSGPQIPATAAVVLSRKLARGDLPGSGARPCLDLFTLDEFIQSLAAYPISTSTQILPS